MYLTLADQRTLSQSNELVLVDEDEVINPLDTNLRVHLPIIGGGSGVAVGRRLVCKTTGLGSLEVLSYEGKRVALVEPRASAVLDAGPRHWIQVKGPAKNYFPLISGELAVTDLSYEWGSVKRHGASVSADARASFQSAMDSMAALGGGRVRVPQVDADGGQFYSISGPLFLQSGVIVQGEGAASYIKNVATVDTPAQQKAVFLPGLYHPVYLQDLTYYTLDNTAIGDRTVTLDTASEAANFTVGEPVVIRSQEQWDQVIGAETYNQPLYQQINRVRSVDAGTGEVGLDFAVDATMTAPEIAKANDPAVVHAQGRSMYVCDRGGVANLSVHSEKLWITEGGALECTFRDIWVRQSQAIVYGNSYAHCRFENIRGVFTRQFVEMSAGSHDNVIRDIDGTYLEGTVENLSPIAFAEQGRNNRLEGFTLDLGEWNLSADMIRLSGVSKTKVRNGRITARGATQSLVHITTVARTPDQPHTEHNEVSDLDIECGAATPSWYLRMSEDVGEVRDNRVARLTARGGTPANYGLDIRGDRNTVVDCNVPGNLRIASAEDCVVEGNIVAGNWSGTDLATIFAINRIRNNETARSRALLALRHRSGASQVVTSTVANNEIHGTDVVAGTLQARDMLSFEYHGTVNGTNNTKTISLADDTGALATLSFAAGETGTFGIEGVARVLSGQIVLIITTAKVTTLARTRTTRTLNLDTTAYNLSFQAWVTSASDNITVQMLDVEASQPGSAT